jgi:hypothetical protein
LTKVNEAFSDLVKPTGKKTLKRVVWAVIAAIRMNKKKSGEIVLKTLPL